LTALRRGFFSFGALRRAGLAFAALPGSTRGILWMALASFTYACTYAVVRELSGSFTAFQIVFFRSALGILFMAPWLVRAGRGALYFNHAWLYWARTACNYVGMVLLMWGIGRLALQNVTALQFTIPLFTVLFVALILGETVGVHRWAALLIGFSGALVIVRPGFVEVSAASLAVLGCSALYGLSNVTTKRLTQLDDPNAVVFHVFSLMMLVGLVPALWHWTTPTLAQLPWIVAMGALSTLATLGTTRGLAAADASVVMPINFLRQPFAVTLGFIFWTELPDIWTGIGSAIIFGAGLYIARHESRARRARAAAA
jgi:drug/metabolite transporter (DMT)-like permease